VSSATVTRSGNAEFDLGLCERPYTDEQREKAVLFAKEHVDAVRRIAQKSIVVLKNNGALLPLSKDVGTIAVIGPLADSKEDMLGSWSAHGKPEEAITVLEGIRAKAGPRTQIVYARGCGVHEGTPRKLLRRSAQPRNPMSFC